MPDLRQAVGAGVPPVLHAALRHVDLNRWLGGLYAVPVKDDEDEDGERKREAES